MASRSQIVPSKNALRALRKLALGGSTVVGAIGSISGLACVSYDIQQRIHLAESIVETKRVLHSQSISNPNRKAHMAAIFDMYEKGQGKEKHESWQDFSRRARRHSAQAHHHNGCELADVVVTRDAMRHADATNEPTGPGSSSGILHNSLGMSSVPLGPHHPPRERTRFVSEETAPSRLHQNSSTARKIIEASQKPHKINSHTVYGRPHELRNTTPVQKIITATQRQHKLTSHAVFGRPASRSQEGLTKLASCVQQWLAPDVVKHRASPLTAPKRPNAPRKGERSYEVTRHYSALAVEAQDDINDPAMRPSRASSQYNNPFFPKSDTKPDSGDYDRVLDLIPLTLAQNTEIDAVSKKSNSQDGSHSQLETENKEVQTTQDVQISISILIESVMWKPKEVNTEEVHDISTFAATSSDSAPPSTDSLARGGIQTPGIDHEHMIDTTSDIHLESSVVLDRLVAVILQVLSRKGPREAKELANNALQIYADGGRPEDFHAMDQLHVEFGAKLRLPFGQSACRLIHYLFNTGLEDDRRRAGGLLFRHAIEHQARRVDQATSVARFQYERCALIYIDWLCSTSVSNSRVVHEFRMVLEETYRRDAPPSERLFSPVLSRFMEHGNLKYLRNMFEEMKVAHGIEPGPLTRKPLLLGYAKANDWNQITTEFETMHRDGVSRREPVRYAMMFIDVFREYAISEPVEKTHDFLVNAICYWGLVPITKVSAIVVQAYIRHRRYDLIKEWVEAARYIFPHVDNSGHSFSLTLAKTWNEIGASCEEIEEACLSIIRGHNSIIPGRFRAVVQEALASHLARKLHATHSDGGESDEKSGQAETVDDLHTLLDSSFAAILEDAGEHGVVRQSSAADLLAQSSAVLRLGELFGAKNSIAAPEVKVAPRLDRPSKKQTLSTSAQTRDLSTPIPDVLRREQLPSRDTVMLLVSTYYLQRLKLGEPISHDILEITCRQLELMRRSYDIHTIISATFAGPAVQGPDGLMFDINIMQIWMEAAYNLKSQSACMQILHAILERGTEIQLTEQFMLLVRMAADKTFGGRFNGRHANLARARGYMTLTYLEQRLRDRFTAQRGNPKFRPERRNYEFLGFRPGYAQETRKQEVSILKNSQKAADCLRGVED